MRGIPVVSIAGTDDTMPTAKRTPARPASIHQLKVTLAGIRPPIWRRILVPSDVTLARLHRVIQEAMGWVDYHLHQFETGGVTYGDLSLNEDGMLDDVVNERTTRLFRVAPSPKNRLLYLYDFGDSWEHIILVEAVLPPEPGRHYPVCLTGRRACPPEDCGGPWGYGDLLTAIADPNHPEHTTLVSWLGAPFDPEAFDLEAINQRLSRLR
jgi:hypothetical protein